MKKELAPHVKLASTVFQYMAFNFKKACFNSFT